MDIKEVEKFLGDEVDVFYDDLDPETQKPKEYSAGGTLVKVDAEEATLELDWGWGISLDSVKRIEKGLTS